MIESSPKRMRSPNTNKRLSEHAVGSGMVTGITSHHKIIENSETKLDDSLSQEQNEV